MKKILVLVFLLVQIGLFIHLDAQVWTSAQRLTYNSGNSWQVSGASDSSGNVFLFWIDGTFGDSDIVMKKSTDAGNTWTPIKRITWSTSPAKLHALVDSNDDLHLVWQKDLDHNYELFYKKSTNLGQTWSAVKRMTYNPGHSTEPRLMKDLGNNLYLCWIDQTFGNSEVVYKKSTDSGSSWLSITRLTWNPGYSSSLFPCSDTAGNVYIFWSDNVAGNIEIYNKKSSNGGANWSVLQRMTWTSMSSDQSYAADTPYNNLHFVWVDHPVLNGEIFYKVSNNGGTSWINYKRLTWDPAESAEPIIIRDGSNDLYLFWSDRKPGNSEIYLKKSMDAGVSWGSSNRLTWTSGNSNDLVSFIGYLKKIHLFWADNTPGNYEIYYKRGTIPIFQ